MMQNSGHTGSNNKMMMIILGVVVVALIAVGAVYFMKKNDTVRTADTQADMASQTAPAADADTQDMPEQAQQAMGGTYNGTPVQPGNPVVAKVDGEDVTRVDVYNFIQLMPAQIQQMPATQVYPLALEQTINTRLIQNKAESANLEGTPDFQRELEIAKQQIARNLYVEKEVSNRITESELRKDYKRLIEEAPSIERRKASHILVESKEKAAELIKKLSDGANFNELAQKESKDPTAAQNAGDLGWFTKDQMVPAFADAVYAMKKGSVSKEPIQSDFGWHVIYLEDVGMIPKPTFEEAKEMLAMQKRREVLEKMVQEWRNNADIEVYDINGNPLKADNATSDAAAAPETTAPAAAPAPEPAPAPAQ